MTQWITNTIETLGYLGVALLMLLENLVPPIPSEVVMPAAGFAARQGEGTLWGYVLAGTLGSLLGTIPYYLLARWIGQQRVMRLADKYGKWIGVSAPDVERAVAWFDRWGTRAIILGRLVPGIRTVISVPAGFAKMHFGKFLLCTTVGTLGWNVALAMLGWYLQSRYQAIEPYLSWIGVAVMAAAGLWLAYRIWKNLHQPHRQSTPSA